MTNTKNDQENCFSQIFEAVCQPSLAMEVLENIAMVMAYYFYDPNVGSNPHMFFDRNTYGH